MVASIRSWGGLAGGHWRGKTGLEFAEGLGVMGYWGSAFTNVCGDIVSGECGEMEGEIGVSTI